MVANDFDNKRCYLMTHQVKRIQSPNCMIINHDARILPNMVTSLDEVGFCCFSNLAEIETWIQLFLSVLQIRRGKRENLGIIFHIIALKHML